MTGKLFKIPLSIWVRNTINKITDSGRHDFKAWEECWFVTYKELGGDKPECGKKECPKHAAYGLWRLGRFKDAGIPYQEVSITQINEKFGKNAAYAALAIELLQGGTAENNIASLWEQVQRIYREKVGDEPARNQQGAVTIAKILYDEKQLISPGSLH